MQTDRGMERRSRKREVPPLAGDGDQARAYCDGCRDARAPHGERRSLAGVPLLRGGHQVPAWAHVRVFRWLESSSSDPLPHVLRQVEDHLLPLI